MLLFLFASLSFFLSLHDAPKQVFLVNQNEGDAHLAPRSYSTDISK